MLRNMRYNALGWVVSGMVFLHATQACLCAGQTPRVGTLHIEGQGIDRLVLQDDTGRRNVFYYREPNLILAEGTYRLDEVVLQGGYSSLRSQIAVEAPVVKIAPGGFATLKVGAPLRQTVRIERWGASLVLNYQVLGQAGESYAVTRLQAAKPPAFVIYQGENQVASGDFQPG